jgi:hypothetical protein
MDCPGRTRTLDCSCRTRAAYVLLEKLAASPLVGIRPSHQERLADPGNALAFSFGNRLNLLL